MRRSLMLLSAAVLAISLTGCGDDGDDTTADAGGPATSGAASTSAAPASPAAPTDDTSEPADPAAPPAAPEESDSPAPEQGSGDSDGSGDSGDSGDSDDDAHLARAWEQLLDDIVDTSASPQQRARLIDDDSEQVAELIAQVDSRMAGYDVRFEVVRPGSQGGVWAGDVNVDVGGRQFVVRKVEFVQRSGDWLLSSMGACGLAAVAGAACNLS